MTIKIGLPSPDDYIAAYTSWPLTVTKHKQPPQGGPDDKRKALYRARRATAMEGWGFPFALGVLGRDKLRDLRGVERRALAQVVAADEELDAVRVVERLADPADPGRVGAHHVGRRRVLAPLGLVVQHDAGSEAERLPGGLPADRAREPGVHRDRVRGDHGHPDAGRVHPQRGQAEDLARLVADLELLRRPARVLERARPRDDVQRQRGRERPEVADHAAHVARSLAEGASAADLLHLLVERVDARLAGAGGGLVGGDDQLLEAERAVQRADRDDQRERGAVR